MYQALGYVVYRKVLEYYADPHPEHAYDMRKALKRDIDQKSIIPLARAIHVSQLEYE
jgi:N-terminal acetyltransferase B complex catalytic subunit